MKKHNSQRPQAFLAFSSQQNWLRAGGVQRKREWWTLSGFIQDGLQFVQPRAKCGIPHSKLSIMSTHQHNNIKPSTSFQVQVSEQLHRSDTHKASLGQMATPCPPLDLFTMVDSVWKHSSVVQCVFIMHKAQGLISSSKKESGSKRARETKPQAASSSLKPSFG